MSARGMPKPQKKSTPPPNPQKPVPKKFATPKKPKYKDSY